MMEIVADPADVSDLELEVLLRRVYVDGGFTDAASAADTLRAPRVRARGELLVARVAEASEPAGMAIVVRPVSPGRRIARADEAELQLLAVSPEYRGRGVGSRLVDAACERARALGCAGLVLWTQPSMQAAQRLYFAHGFVRCAERDSELAAPAGRTFLVFTKRLAQ
ncbi:MAG: GNAT family N-acetyltransferase [Polyangiaceae bacterium]